MEFRVGCVQAYPWLNANAEGEQHPDAKNAQKFQGFGWKMMLETMQTFFDSNLQGPYTAFCA